MIEDKFGDFIREIVRQVIAEVGESEPPRLYDPDETAKILKVPKRWVYEKVSQKAIPFRKVGRYLRFSSEDLRQIIEGKGK